MRKVIGGMAVFAVLMSLSVSAEAQRRATPQRRAAQKPVTFAIQADFGSDTDFGIGGRAIFGLRSLFPTTPLDGHVSFDYYFPDDGGTGADVTYWEINGNVGYRIPNVRGSWAPYVGGGLNIAHASASFGGFSSSATDVGLNLLGGSTFGRGASVRPFAEARVTVGGGEQFVISGGVRF